MNLKKPIKKTIVVKVKTPIAIVFILFLFIACEKEQDTDARNGFVGNWLVNENSLSPIAINRYILNTHSVHTTMIKQC